MKYYVVESVEYEGQSVTSFESKRDVLDYLNNKYNPKFSTLEMVICGQKVDVQPVERVVKYEIIG